MPPEATPKQFASPEEEIAYLRDRIAHKERELLTRTPELDRADVETLGRQELQNYGEHAAGVVLHENHQLSPSELTVSVEQTMRSGEPTEDIVALATEKGIHNALSVLEKHNDPHLTDEVHRRLVELIKSGRQIQNLNEGVPPWHILHMTLFEVTLPKLGSGHDRERTVSEIVSMMEQLLLGLQSIGYHVKGQHFTIEVAVAEGSDDIVYYVSVPNDSVDLFEKQTLSIFPNAIITEQVHDYNIFVDNGSAEMSVVKLKRHPLYPLRTKDTFETDPLSVILNAFSKIERDGGGAALQITIRHAPERYYKKYNEVIDRVQKGMKVGEALSRSSTMGEVTATLGELFSSSKKKSEDPTTHFQPDQDEITLFKQKIATPILETNFRLVASAVKQQRAQQILSESEAVLNQFGRASGNQFVAHRLKGSALKKGLKAFTFREFSSDALVPLSVDELATFIHLPANGVESSPQFKQSNAKTAAAPTNMPTSGTLLGINSHRNQEKEIFITPEDRLRHFYIIGQTGTGKTTLMKNMIVQDILNGDGVCMIDPHGTDIEDVLGAVPPEREDDVIYFDPSRMDQVLGLNMLEYDYKKPEQKTFVVNELFSIFQKLYGANPESMGPMFEQYFRNATLLVMEDPESGNTLMDISRVMADARYRRYKLSKAKNPTVVQFWSEIATKAGGEASLENIVPYIVSKFDVFTANDYIRPIIGQQTSSFNFREIMDNRKILLVNLSKGRLGEINANLIGMILVGKILMAALSRVDDPSKSFPPFYLHMDEFQNISTDSIPSILSEARKYKLGLTVAHQFIAQLEPSIRDAVFGNVGSMVTFRVGPDDGEFLAHQFEPVFSANDLMNIPNRNAYVRVLANGSPTSPFSIKTLAPADPDPTRVELMIEQSYAMFGRRREEVETEIRNSHQPPQVSPPTRQTIPTKAAP